MRPLAFSSQQGTAPGFMVILLYWLANSWVKSLHLLAALVIKEGPSLFHLPVEHHYFYAFAVASSWQDSVHSVNLMIIIYQRMTCKALYDEHSEWQHYLHLSLSCWGRYCYFFEPVSASSESAIWTSRHVLHFHLCFCWHLSLLATFCSQSENDGDVIPTSATLLLLVGLQLPIKSLHRVEFLA